MRFILNRLNIMLPEVYWICYMMECEFAISFAANVNLEKMAFDRGGCYGEAEGRRDDTRR